MQYIYLKQSKLVLWICNGFAKLTVWPTCTTPSSQPRITSCLPILNLKGLSLSREESNLRPSVREPREEKKKKTETRVRIFTNLSDQDQFCYQKYFLEFLLYSSYITFIFIPILSLVFHRLLWQILTSKDITLSLWTITSFQPVCLAAIFLPVCILRVPKKRRKKIPRMAEIASVQLSVEWVSVWHRGQHQSTEQRLSKTVYTSDNTVISTRKAECVTVYLVRWGVYECVWEMILCNNGARCWAHEKVDDKMKPFISGWSGHRIHLWLF